MSILLNRTKLYLINHQSGWREGKHVYQVLILCVALLVGCQVSKQEETFEFDTLSPTPTQAVATLETPSAIATTVIIVTPLTTTLEPTTPSPTTVLLTPSQTKMLATLSPTVAPVTRSTNHFTEDNVLLYGIINIDEESQIYALQPGGTSRFITTGQLLSGRAYSPDGTKLIVDTNDWSSPPLSPDKVFILDLETGEMLPLNLLAHPRNGVFWSADGTSLLYVARYPDGADDQLVLYNITSGENEVLVEMEHILFTAGWSVDGQTIAFVTEVDGQYDLFTVNSNTLEKQQITDNSEIETMVLWSPVASQLLVGNNPDDGHVFEMWPWGVESLYLLDTNSDNLQLLTDKFLTSESVSWSPDGKQIMFSDAGLLCIKNLETMAETCPLADAAPYNGYFASFWEPPVWSTSGNWLAFSAYNDTCDMVYFLELDTKTVMPSDLGCDVIFQSPLAPIYWLPTNLNEPP